MLLCLLQRRLLVIGTTGNAAATAAMGLRDAFHHVLAVPAVADRSQVLEVLAATAEMGQASQRAMADVIQGPVGIKKLLLAQEVAKQDGSFTERSFRDACVLSGVALRSRS